MPGTLTSGSFVRGLGSQVKSHKSTATPAKLTLPFPTLSPTDTNSVQVIFNNDNVSYTFAPSPGVGIYLGIASGDPSSDAATLASAINSVQSASGSSSSNATTITIIGLALGASAFVSFSGFLNGIANGTS